MRVTLIMLVQDFGISVISPVDTRKVLIFRQAIKNNPIPDTQFPVLECK